MVNAIVYDYDPAKPLDIYDKLQSFSRTPSLKVNEKLEARPISS